MNLQEAKDFVWDKLVDYIKEGRYTAESIYQSDSAQENGLELIVEILEKLDNYIEIDYDQEYENEKDSVKINLSSV